MVSQYYFINTWPRHAVVLMMRAQGSTCKWQSTQFENYKLSLEWKVRRLCWLLLEQSKQVCRSLQACGTRQMEYCHITPVCGQVPELELQSSMRKILWVCGDPHTNSNILASMLKKWIFESSSWSGDSGSMWWWWCQLLTISSRRILPAGTALILSGYASSYTSCTWRRPDTPPL